MSFLEASIGGVWLYIMKRKAFTHNICYQVVCFNFSDELDDNNYLVGVFLHMQGTKAITLTELRTFI